MTKRHLCCKTKQIILEKACQLFAEKGFKDVTMQDICEQSGLSRGGLYRHFESTGQIFLEIVNAFTDRQKARIMSEIRQSVPATVILDNILSAYQQEMGDVKASLSLAIYEFYSNPAIAKTENAVTRQYENSKSAWLELIQYRIKTGEFKTVNPESVFHLIVFAYQGVRMYSRLMDIGTDIPAQIIGEIKRLLLTKEVLYE